MKLPLDAVRPPPGPRWRDDPYVTYHAEIAHRQGLLTTPNSGVVQQALLLGVEYRERKEEHEQIKGSLEGRFEMDLMLHRPELWEAYRASKSDQAELDDLGVDEIEWKSPESAMEAESVANDFAAIDEAWQAKNPTQRGQALRRYLKSQEMEEIDAS